MMSHIWIRIDAIVHFISHFLIYFFPIFPFKKTKPNNALPTPA
jgi:hypothetical protein